MGRPVVPIDWELFSKLCSLQCTQLEIASFFKCSVDTLENRCKSDKGMTYSEYFTQNCGNGKISLRRQQWKLAEKGNATMLIWLGKQYLEQKDRSDITSAGTKISNGVEITVIHKKEDVK